MTAPVRRQLMPAKVRAANEAFRRVSGLGRQEILTEMDANGVLVGESAAPDGAAQPAAMDNAGDRSDGRPER